MLILVTNTLAIYHECMIFTRRHIHTPGKTALYVQAGLLACAALCLPLTASADSDPAGDRQPTPARRSAPVPPPLAPPIRAISAEDNLRFPAADTADPRYRPSIKPARVTGEELPVLPDRTLPFAPATAAVPATEPPTLPDRPPIPVPADERLPALRAPAAPKPPLAWRAKAYALSEKGSATPMSASISRTFDRSSQDVFSAIVSACPIAGMVIDSLNSSAGDVLLLFPDDPTHASGVIINVKASAPLRTTVTGIVVPSGRTARQAALDKFLSDIELILARNGAT